MDSIESLLSSMESGNDTRLDDLSEPVHVQVVLRLFLRCSIGFYLELNTVISI